MMKRGKMMKAFAVVLTTSCAVMIYLTACGNPEPSAEIESGNATPAASELSWYDVESFAGSGAGGGGTSATLYKSDTDGGNEPTTAGCIKVGNHCDTTNGWDQCMNYVDGNYESCEPDENTTCNAISERVADTGCSSTWSNTKYQKCPNGTTCQEVSVSNCGDNMIAVCKE